eukprot:9231379-Lingulodinium_polyedra.AAC.1
MRRMLKGCSAPPVYWAQVPGANPSTGEEQTQIWLPFLLMHEVMAMLLGGGHEVGAMATLPANVPGLQRLKEDWCRKH